MFTKSAAYYDAIYSARGKDYAHEARLLHALIQHHKRALGNTLLDLACGTGSHLHYLQQWYQVEGLDLDAALLQLAKQKLPGIPFHQANMLDFALRRQFDVVTCLFSSIGYVKTRARLGQAMQNMQRHTSPGGLVIVEPWFSPADYDVASVHATFVDHPDLKIARMNVSEMKDNISILDFHYLVATKQGVEHFTEQHELGLFSHEEYLTAFAASGLETMYDSKGLAGRGLYIGINSDGVAA
jgi:SAM-dependent methyltransferase